MIQPWQIRQSEEVVDCRVFKVRKDVTVNPRTGKAHDMYVLEQPNWVNVIPLTPDEQVILVQQWRHGSRTVELETPGGLMDESETPEQCARRELLEETGYEPGDLVRLGQPSGKYAGTHTGRLAGIRADGRFDIKAAGAKITSGFKNFTLIQRGDGYGYAH